SCTHDSRYYLCYIFLFSICPTRSVSSLFPYTTLFRSLGIFLFEAFVFGFGLGEGHAIFGKLSLHLFHSWDITVQQFGDFGSPFFAVEGTNITQKLIQLLALLVEPGHLLEDAGRDMVAARLACALAALQVGVFLDHVLPELVLPPGQLLFVAHDVLGTQAAVRRQWDKRKVHMGRFLVHMHHGGEYCFFGLLFFEEAQGLGKERFDLGTILSLKEVRCSGEQHLHYPDAVLPGAATSGTDLALGLGPVPLGWLNQMEVVLAAGKVNVGVTGVFFFSALVMGLDVGYF